MRVLIGVIIFLIVFIVYYSAVHNHFVNWDDEVYILENVWIKQHSLKRFLELFKIYVGGNYHPLTILTYWIEYYFAGEEKAYIYHLTSVIIHSLNSVLVFMLIKEFISNRWASGIMAIIWGIHPLHVESVAWISERKDVLYSFFYLLGLIFYIKKIKSKGIGFRSAFIVLILHLMSLMSKPAAIAFPLSLICVNYYFYGFKWLKIKGGGEIKKDKQRGSYNIFLGMKVLLVLSFILSIIFAIITLDAQKGAIMDVTVVPFQYRLLVASFGFFTYYIKFFYPYDQTPFYPYPDFSIEIPKIFYFAVVFTVGVIFTTLWFIFKNKHRIVSFAHLFYFVNLILVLQIVAIGSAVAAERYSYMPHVGLCIMVGSFIERVIEKLKFYLIPGIAVICIFFISRTQDMIKIWKDGETLWSYFIKMYPNLGKGYFHLAGWYAEFLKDYDKAFHYYMETIKRSPSFVESYVYIGNIYGIRNKYDSALYFYRKAEAAGFADYTLYSNKAILFSILGEVDSALIEYEKAIKKNPYLPDAYANRAILFERIGRVQDALKDIDKAIFYSPNDPKLYRQRAFINAKLNNRDAALKDILIYLKSIQGKEDTAAINLLNSLKSK